MLKMLKPLVVAALLATTLVPAHAECRDIGDNGFCYDKVTEFNRCMNLNREQPGSYNACQDAVLVAEHKAKNAKFRGEFWQCLTKGGKLHLGDPEFSEQAKRCESLRQRYVCYLAVAGMPKTQMSNTGFQITDCPRSPSDPMYQ